ncbi:MAG: hypothetical protein ACREP6_10320 [Candidatus Binataceae bacterium]
MKIKINLGGQTVEADKMDFKPLDEPWAEYKLEDGNVVKLKIVVSSVFKLPAPDPVTGLPQYIIQSSNVMSVEPPRAGKDELN